MAADDSDSPDLDYLDEYDPSRGIPFSSHLLAGSVAGLAEHLVVFPLDTLKTHAQCVGTCSRAQGPDVFCLKAARQLSADAMSTNAGALRLFRGVGAVTVACVPAHAMYFGAFEVVRGIDAGAPSHATNALAGAVAVVGHDCVMTPADVIKQRMQLGHHRGLADAWRATLAGGGLPSLYRSLPTTLAMNVPYGCFSVAANEALKGWVQKRTGKKPGLGGLLACGGAAGAVASLLTTPLDVIKTRLQTQDLSWARHSSLGAAGVDSGRRGLASMAVPGGGHVAYRGFFDAARGIWTADGAVGFYRGAAVRALAQAPSVAIVWTTYEMLVRALAPTS